MTTASWRALQLFAQARLLSDGQQREAAVELLREAVKADPEFALAHLYLARYVTAHDERLRRAERALELAGKVSERERFFIQGYHAYLAAGDQKAIPFFEALLALHPDDSTVSYLLSRNYLRVGRAQEGTALTVRIADLRPNCFICQVEASHGLVVWGGEIDRARFYYQRSRTLSSAELERAHTWSSAFVAFFPAHEFWVRGQAASALAEVNRLAANIPARSGVNRDALATYAGLLYLALGRLLDAEGAFQYVSADNDRNALLAAAAFAADDLPKVRQHLEIHMASGGTRRASALTLALLIRSGLLAAAHQELEARKREQFSPHYQTNLLGMLALAHGNRQQALPLLEEGNRQLSHAGSAAFFLGAESLALALEQEGRIERERAVLEWAAAQKVRSYVLPRPAGYFQLRTQFLLAEHYRRNGKPDSAVVLEDDLRRTLAVADAGHPILVQIERNRAKYPGTAASGR